MMKVKVTYTATVEEVIEVDEKFYPLTEPGGWNELSNQERKTLTDEFLEEIVNQTNVDCQYDILCAETDGTEEIMYES